MRLLEGAHIDLIKASRSTTINRALRAFKVIKRRYNSEQAALVGKAQYTAYKAPGRAYVHGT